MKKPWLSALYNISMLLLSVTTIILLIIESTRALTRDQAIVLDTIDTVILVIFAADYFTRLIMAKGKWKFIKSNVADLLSIIPFSQVFQALRVLRVVKIFRLVRLTRLGRAARLFSVFGKLCGRCAAFVKTNNFIYAAYIAGCAGLFGAVGISYFEGIGIGDALWWSVVTTTTVGYGDISPRTAIGKLIAVVLMIAGIGFISMLTGTISTYFIDRAQKSKEEPPQKEGNFILDLNGLSNEDKLSVQAYVDFLKARASGVKAN
ncbi:MAG: ion transporter [Christensenellaceae bacterium]|nr:ion transporter [Christensenellaceae bacterium]